jgi:hypothetical protein
MGGSALTASLVALQFLAQRNDDTVHCLYVLDQKPFRKVVDPGHSQAYLSGEGLLTLLTQNDELRPLVMRVRLETD